MVLWSNLCLIICIQSATLLVVLIICVSGLVAAYSALNSYIIIFPTWGLKAIIISNYYNSDI